MGRRFTPLAAANVLGVMGLLSGCAAVESTDAREATQPPASAEVVESAAGNNAPNDYGNPSSWLCLPGQDDYCAVDLSTTVVHADGRTAIEAFEAASNPAVDCFYVYPTASMDRTPNSDMTPGPGEISVVAAQFARYGSVCRTFAPIYRQITLTALRANRAGTPMAVDYVLAYGDVVDAWEHYLAHHNNGRGVLLVGHSQGSGMLSRLIAERIEGTDGAELMIAAHLIGTRIAIPEGELVGGTFKQTPLCTSADEVGCLVTFAAFRDTIPPPEDTLFGRVPDAGAISACNNPAELDGSDGELHAYLASEGPGISSLPQGPWADGVDVSTPFVSAPGLLSARCVNDDRGSRLDVTVHADASDARTDDISGDVVINGEVQPGWGLHLIDVHLGMGNLLNLARSQSEAWLAERE